MGEALGRLVYREAEADRVVSVTGVQDETLGQIVREVGEGGLENRRNRF